MGCCNVCVNKGPGCGTPIFHQFFNILLILVGFVIGCYIALYIYLVFVVQDKIKRGVYGR
jgi:hypothetical protein